MHRVCFARVAFRKPRTGLLAVAVLLASLQGAMAQDGADSLRERKTALEIRKLELEIEDLEASRDWPDWLTPLVAVATGVASAAVTLLVARRARAGQLDQATHEARLQCYPELVKATSPFAIHFPEVDASGAASLDSETCGEIGLALSRWYFGGGGLLLSEEARDAYFALARALTRASSAPRLQVPRFPDDAERISSEKVDEYRKQLGESRLDRVEAWVFGPPAGDGEVLPGEPHLAFKDYVFLQRLSSRLRTRLTEDLKSRRRPA